jgi:hypothetical protein
MLAVLSPWRPLPCLLRPFHLPHGCAVGLLAPLPASRIGCGFSNWLRTRGGDAGWDASISWCFCAATTFISLNCDLAAPPQMPARVLPCNQHATCEMGVSVRWYSWASSSAYKQRWMDREPERTMAKLDWARSMVFKAVRRSKALDHRLDA